MIQNFNIGLQLYGLRDILEETPERFEELMKEVKAMGYDGVELAGLNGLSPEYVRETLDAVGLVPISAHVPFADMVEDIDAVIAEYSKIGVKYLVMPYMTEEYRPVNPAGFEGFLPLLNEVGRKINEAGMTFLYHNHDFEFEKLPDGQYGYDKMFSSLTPEILQCELDTCWCSVATGDPEGFIRKYAGRMPIVHLKDYIKKGQVKNMYQLIGIDDEEGGEEKGFFEFRPVGFGQMIWEPIIAAAKDAGASWLIVEQDQHYDLPSPECARRSIEYLKILA